ncbi:PepSY-associated TM helix domain-containing protein [Pseudoalteromonas fenneropenaei]|uniref:PepSY-associated TM helix domain-containing protein n=1 Tax=Pseudoalteromonas fenneropenaei TaxID=1737459 RepID=A0ABV7CIY5_9GAMM
MKDSFFRSMTWLHTWVGLLAIWLLLLIFFAGTISFFRHEITLWSQPGFHRSINPELPQQSQRTQLEHSLARLQQQAPHAASWSISPATTRQPFLYESYRLPAASGERRGKQVETYYDASALDTALTYQDSKGGNFFYRLHFDLHYLDVITARWLVCLASLFMLVALISGIVIHKRIFKDMFQLRGGKGVRTWLDAHNVSSVLALPFHLMITYTGLITLIFMLFPYPALTQFNGDFRAFFEAQNPTRAVTKASGEAVAMLPAPALLDQVYTRWPEVTLTRVILENPNDRNAVLKVYASNGTQIQDEKPVLKLSAVDGTLIAAANEQLSGGETFYDAMNALHAGRMAEPLLRWLFFGCGLLGCAMLASGAVMWAKRIRERMKTADSASFGLQLVESLNLATIMGLPLACCAFFYANRLLPSTVAGRSEKEILAFFLTWLACIIVASKRKDTTQWRRFALLNACCWALLPLVSALQIDTNLINAFMSGKTLLWAFDVVCFITAAVFGYQALHLRKHQLRTAWQLQTVRA